MIKFLQTGVFILLCGIFMQDLFAQNDPQWRILPNAPIAQNFRNEDVFFVSPTTGWVTANRGQIYKTTDGGASWNLQISSNTVTWRSLGFADELHGWAGHIGPSCFTPGFFDSVAVYQTIDGGSNWTPVTNLPEPKPAGICGMSVVDRMTVYLVGRICSPAVLIKTSDGGQSWTTIDMSNYMNRIVDAYFFSPDSGFIAGGDGLDYIDIHGKLLFTADGGQTWQEKWVSPSQGQWGWKFSFPTPTTGYVSLETENTALTSYFLKTTDGGATWEQKLLFGGYREQGIGFASETLGWVGGSAEVYRTVDGGNSWQLDDFGDNINRFRMLSDTLGYAIGKHVYKYSRQPAVAIDVDLPEVPDGYTLQQNFPNPFNPSTTIRYSLTFGEPVTLTIYDVNGRAVKTLVNEYQPAGQYAINFEAGDLPGGVYFYKLQAGNFAETKKMLLVR